MRQLVVRARAGGQAIVEFALAATLIFFLLAAVVDIGLMYFTLQALRVAAQEGATFGSYPVQVANGNVDIPYAEITNRVYGAAGDQGGGFANLRDLNANGRDDRSENLHADPRSPNAFIFVENLRGANPTNLTAGQGCRGDQRGVELQNGGLSQLGVPICWIRVTVRYEYRLFFPFAPAFADTVRLQASHLMPMRSSFFTSR
ncbi:MAG TPA: pilus assembly protein [Chloroflexaceae bacterium]|mgnify:CR=1 FL=1|nr:pilus assembly protein [Chloroflexaceae bacterium]